jgi:hypothetical protein
MAGTDKGSNGFTRNTNQVFIKTDALIAFENWLSYPEKAVSVTDNGGDVGNLVSLWLSLAAILILKTKEDKVLYVNKRTSV